MPALIVKLVMAAAGLFAAIVALTRRRDDWGLNFGSVTCPNCRTRVSRFRPPRSGRQALWGGWSCPNCGQELDKWGRKR